ncbi:Very-long-chain (3R)-3-hydroxyacyl-CoA dehydratase [Nibea albiflora]|uniref:Very-long-chain (3R)-3-hydroxyacyl-CoA dehydratase n=1 Tax=Nibea albiflora TaxID=240163 RepID=A0ACB7FDZ7_NIBAL|nr:Very-long-chain (3R)-3-hydroxyacyl-CoA dehydratase [Nibea albiflora]
MALTPLVYWAQRHEEIYLRVELTDAQVRVNGTLLGVAVHLAYCTEIPSGDSDLYDHLTCSGCRCISAQGHGAKGQNEYEFSLEFLLPVKPEVSHKSTQRQVNITVRKAQRGWWERLVVQERKPVFLAPDFDRWLDESDAEMEIREKFLGFSWIFVNMTVRLFIFGQGEERLLWLKVSHCFSFTDPIISNTPLTSDSLYDTFHTISDVMFFCQILAAVEVLNAAFGVVRTSVIPTLIQVVGRNFVLFIIFGSLEKMHNQPVVFFVFYLWSAIEIFRYPFYMLGCFNTEWKTLTWLRYTVWIPLYPLGVLAEAVAVIQSIPIFDENKFLSIPLPKAIGTSISFSYFLHVYLVLMFLGLFINFRHLYKQRNRRFHTKKRKAK